MVENILRMNEDDIQEKVLNTPIPQWGKTG
jgi:hypothetical protein